MPFGRLSPVSESVSETDTESLHSSRPDSTDLRPRPLNFSRPKPQDFPSSRHIQRDIQYATSTSSSSSNTTAGSARGVGAFYEPPPPETHELPTELRLSSESERDGDSIAPSTRSARSAGSELVWDVDAGELRSQHALSRRGNEFDAQRYAAPRRPHNRSYPTNSSGATESELPLIAELPGDEPSPRAVAQQKQDWQKQEQQRQDLQKQEQQRQEQQKRDQQNRENSKPTFGNFLPQKAPRIIKSTSVEQQSERKPSISSSIDTATTRTSGRTAGWEDSHSQRTVSESGDRQAGGGTEWKSSEYDVSELSEKKLAKLKKKGINPQLYMEMKAARGGKGKLVGPLVGNTYIG
jgi:hypothetical protein